MHTFFNQIPHLPCFRHHGLLPCYTISCDLDLGLGAWGQHKAKSFDIIFSHFWTEWDEVWCGDRKLKLSALRQHLSHFDACHCDLDLKVAIEKWKTATLMFLSWKQFGWWIFNCGHDLLFCWSMLNPFYLITIQEREPCFADDMKYTFNTDLHLDTSEPVSFRPCVMHDVDKIQIDTSSDNLVLHSGPQGFKMAGNCAFILLLSGMV